MPRLAVVTGAMSGLGAATSSRLRLDGITVLTIDVAEGADFVLDVSDTEAVRALVTEVGPIDILINSAGIIGANSPLWEVSDEQWNRVFAVNVTGTFALCRAFVPGMIEKGWGRIVNFASIAGKEGNANLSPYSASKAAIIGLTKSLGKELATTGVLVNAIAPALVQTPMAGDISLDALVQLRSLIPMNRMGKAEEVAELVAWVASDRMSFSTGAVFDVSGGRATY